MFAMQQPHGVQASLTIFRAWLSLLYIKDKQALVKHLNLGKKLASNLFGQRFISLFRHAANAHCA